MQQSNRSQRLLILILAGSFSFNAFGYGGGAKSTTSCKKPRFTQQLPAPSSVVTPGSEFSFTASADTKRKSIKVTVEGESVDLEIVDQKNGKYAVSGLLPETITKGHIKLTINADSIHKCPVKDGWLLKVAEN